MTVTTPRIVVGVDDSEESIAALAWAIRQAQVTGAAIEVVYAFQRPIPVPYSPAVRVPAAEFAAEGRLALDEVVSGCLALYPDVQATITVVERRAADALTEAARGAELLVLGSSGTLGIVALLAGSTDYAVIQHAPCPLVLVPHPLHREGGRQEGAVQQDPSGEPPRDQAAVGRAGAGNRERSSPLERRLRPRRLRADPDR